jgi:hypothetical protein
MDTDLLLTYAGPALIGAGVLVLLVVVLRPGTPDHRGAVPLVFADDEPYPGLGDAPASRLPEGAERLLASMLEVDADPRNQRAIVRTPEGPMRATSAVGDPDTGVIRVIGREAVRRNVPDTTVEQHPARRPA